MYLNQAAKLSRISVSLPFASVQWPVIIPTWQLCMRLQVHVCELRKRVDRKINCKDIETPNVDELLVAAFERAATAFPSRIALGSDVWEPTYRD